MKKLSKRAIMIRAMHDKGLTYEDIGEIMGITKQAVHQAASSSDGFHEKSILKIPYIGLRNWMLENRITILELSRRCGRSNMNTSVTGGCELRKCTIDAILRITGLSYEECFKEEKT